MVASRISNLYLLILKLAQVPFLWPIMQNKKSVRLTKLYFENKMLNHILMKHFLNNLIDIVRVFVSQIPTNKTWATFL